MKTKNTRVRVKDIKAGVTIYVAHPFYGVEKLLIMSKPRSIRYSDGKLFFKCKKLSKYGCFTKESSAADNGIIKGKATNGRRAFKKEKQAIDYAERMKLCPAITKQYKEHQEWCRENLQYAQS